MPLLVLRDGTRCFAPLGELVVVDGGRQVLCHLCGRAFAWLGASHLRAHGWTAVLYREAFGLRRGSALCAPAVVERRRELGLARYAENTRLREGLAVGQAMARSGELLERSHAAQPAGSARAETRRRAAQRSEPMRQRTVDAAAARLQTRLVELGFPDALPGYLTDRYLHRRRPVAELARELRVGNQRITQLLDEAGIARRRPGGAGPACGRRAWETDLVR